MRNPIPPIAETVDDLKQRLHQERNVHKQQRLQMLYLLAGGQAHQRQEVAALLDVHRNTIGRWLDTYAAGGLEALLDIYVASGKPLSRRSASPPDLLPMKRYAGGCGRPITSMSSTKRSIRSCERTSRPSLRCHDQATQKTSISHLAWVISQ